MLRKWMAGMLAVLLIWTMGGAARAETEPVTAEELEEMAGRIREMGLKEQVVNDPAAEDAESEDGTAFQYDFGVLYADSAEMTAETKIQAAMIMDSEIPTVRGITVDWTVNQIMEAIPCDNEGMYGLYEEAALYLTGDPEGGFAYGIVERDGQRIAAMEYGVWDPAKERRIAVIFGISGDGVDSVRIEGMETPFGAEDAREMYEEIDAVRQRAAYGRVPRSLNGTELEMFSEADLDFPSLSYRTAEPIVFGDNVEDMMMDNGDGTWLRRIDGDGFEAVFICDSAGEHADLISYTILSPEMEGPRCVRLGDLFHEDFTRFRSGEGDIDESGLKEVLYGTVGQAPYGLAEYGDGTEMTLRYVTPTMGGSDVEMILRYENTVLTEIILHTVEEDN